VTKSQEYRSEKVESWYWSLFCWALSRSLQGNSHQNFQKTASSPGRQKAIKLAFQANSALWLDVLSLATHANRIQNARL
jgi:hypothetical protein